MDEGRMEKFIPGRWKGEGGGVDRKRLLGYVNALWTARWRRKQQTLFVAVLEERARIQFQEGRKRLGGFRQIMDSYDSGRWWVRETLRSGSTGDTLHLGTGGIGR